MTVFMLLGRIFFLPFLILKYALLRSVRDETGRIVTLDNPRRLRLALEDLGGIFIKFGELLAMRFDLLPLSYAVQLLNIRQSAGRRTEERPRDDLFEVFRQEIGKPMSAVFESIDPGALSVSIFYQSYRAKLAGNDVVVKIQKPDARPEARADLYVLRFLASLLDDVWIFEWLADELDLAVEAKNSSSLYDHAQHYHKTDVLIPMVYSDFTKKRVLVREYLPGMKADRIIALLATHPDDARAALEKNVIALAATSRGFIRDMMRQYFVDGFFHLNPYPSSLLLMSGGQFSYTDFGIIGRAMHPTASFLIFWKASQNLDFDDAAGALVDFAEPVTRAPFEKLLSEDASARERFRKVLDILKEKLTVDITPIFNEWHRDRSGVVRRTSAPVIVSLLERLRFYKLTLPPDAIAFLRALLMLELVALKLDPTFDLADAIRDFIEHTPVATTAAIEEAPHAEEIEPINEFESLHTVNIAPEAMAEMTIRAGETVAHEREKFNGWISVLAERVPDLYNEIKYL
ncbi:MAG: AarF/ABC1/UbiB kinase family protein [Candidatus Niyogibacteria bacterium]|nr:AarF/ABC1/UbiB kinase family protein [Candidatus Niyogibacteria bacterium]